MKDLIYQMNVAGYMLRYRLRSAETLRYFCGCMFPAEGSEYDIAVEDEHMVIGRRYHQGQSDAYVEAKLLINQTSRRLLCHGASVFHAVAFAWRGYAWLLAGPSGAGKTTQFRLWKSIFDSEVEMICGDMPILAMEPDGMFRVFPSAWNGKERWSGIVSAPLGGIIFLRHAEENKIERVTPAQSVSSILQQIICVPETEQEIADYAAFTDRLLSDYPVWLLCNRADKCSVRLTQRTLEAYLAERNGK
jgi:hypothetical protein